jgi:hypothetical protein
MNIYSIVKYVIYGAGLHSLFYYIIPNNRELLLQIAYESVVFCSKIQLYSTKFYDNIKYKLSLWNIIKKTDAKYQVIKNNNSYEIFLKDLNNYTSLTCMDYIVYTDQTTNKHNKVFYFNIPTDFYYNNCKYRFILANLNIFNTTYAIKLYSETENYFVTNNRLNKYTLSYILNNQFNKTIENEPYILEFIDQHIEMKVVTEKDEIIFNSDDYTIRPFIFDKNSFYINKFSSEEQEQEQEEEEEEEEDEEEEESDNENQKETNIEETNIEEPNIEEIITKDRKLLKKSTCNMN